MNSMDATRLGLRACIHVELVDEHGNQPRYLQVQDEDDIG
jgi:hypothetical protein